MNTLAHGGEVASRLHDARQDLLVSGVQEAVLHRLRMAKPAAPSARSAARSISTRRRIEDVEIERSHQLGWIASVEVDRTDSDQARTPRRPRTSASRPRRNGLALSGTLDPLDLVLEEERRPHGLEHPRLVAAGSVPRAPFEPTCDALESRIRHARESTPHPPARRGRRYGAAMPNRLPPGVVRGDDGVARCFWCGGDPLYRAYHDREWGFPVADDVRLFEKLCLEGFQAGLSWLTILRKREDFRRAFRGFEIERVARMGARDVTRLLGDAGIVRHRGKIEAAIANARAAREAGRRVRLARALRLALRARSGQPEPPAPRDARRAARLTESAESRALSKELRARGFRFVGPDHGVRLHAGDGARERSPRGLRRARTCANGARALSPTVGGRMREARASPSPLLLLAALSHSGPGRDLRERRAAVRDRLPERLEDPRRGRRAARRAPSGRAAR